MFLLYLLQIALTSTQAKNLRIITMSVAATGAILNAAVILAIIINPLKTLRRGAWVTILNLAIADLISCTSTIGIWGSKFFKLHDNMLYDDICQFMWYFGISASFLELTFFTVQIYMITKFPLKSRLMFTEIRTILLTLAVWLLSFLLGLSQITYRYFPRQLCLKLYVVHIGVLLIALFIQVFLNIHVAIAITRSGRSTGDDPCQNTKHKNIAKTVIILTIILFVTAFPFFLLKLIEYICRMGYVVGSKNTMRLDHIFYCYAPVAMVNFAANPILYSLRLADYRQTLLAFLGRIKSNNAALRRRTLYTSTKMRTRSSFQRSSIRRSVQAPLVATNPLKCERNPVERPLEFGCSPV